MAWYSIQNGFSGGELSPSLFGRTDLAKYHLGASTLRNCFVNYRGGASSRAGLAYIGMCKQNAPNHGGTATAYPPRDINFQFNLLQGYALEFGDQYMRIKSRGAYVTEAAITLTSVSTAALFTTPAPHGLLAGDWIFAAGVTGFSGLTWVVKTVPTTATFTVEDLFGNAISSATASTGGTVARVYTLTTPYAAVDLPYLKTAQSADTMTICCVNQETLTEYAPQELVRHAATNWSITAVSFASALAAPTGIAVAAQASTTLSTYYSYCVTAVNADGQESIASATKGVENNNISIYAGSNTITWTNVAGAVTYNVYSSTPSYNQAVPAGVPYGYIGTSFGGSFVDTNILADFTKTPPLHKDPFARGAILSVTATAQGTGYTQATVGYTITTSTGTGAVLEPVVTAGGGVAAYIVHNGGSGYAAADTVAITGGSSATANLVVGPQTGTYPSVVGYYQQRRVYANTLANPNTYYMSQPGAYSNMDASSPVVDSDAITGAPWAQQINGIQFMTPMPGGLVVLSGGGAWQVNGGASGAAITPASQVAQPQAYNGCNNTVPPIVVNYDVLYVQAQGSIVRDLQYNYYVAIYTGTDTTVLSNHLFAGHMIKQWAYAEEPYKLIWCVREDGVALSLTYLKEQDIYAWTHHDTDGLIKGVCSVIEPPVNAPYFIVQRYISGHWVYYAERMDDRQWETAEDCFCVDAGLAYPQTFPNTTLTPAAATGTSNISSVHIIDGGHGYTSPIAFAVDATGSGTGATFSVTVSSGVITAITPILQGTLYTQGQTVINITDTTGVGAKASAIITDIVNFTASSASFTSGMVGDVIRVGGGKATITTYHTTTSVDADITQPITEILQNDPDNTPVPATSGDWSIGTPTTSVSGLNHLEGKAVSILADGSVVAGKTVTNGAVTLPQAASQIVIGLPYTVQVQTMYHDAHDGQQDTAQGKRKSISAVVLRTENSRGFSAGVNQADAAVQPDGANVPWTRMSEAKERNALIHAGANIPLFTGDSYIEVFGDWSERGQVAVQNVYPLPLNLLAVITLSQTGDTSA